MVARNLDSAESHDQKTDEEGEKPKKFHAYPNPIATEFLLLQPGSWELARNEATSMQYRCIQKHEW